MSSNQNNLGQKKVTSITHKMQWLVAGDKLGKAFSNSIGMIIILTLAWIAEAEYMVLGHITLRSYRAFYGAGSFDSIMYKVSDSAGNLLFERSIFPEFYYILGIGAFIFVLRILDLLCGLGKERRRIKNILAPIDEIAMRADEIAKLGFSEDKYQLLEEAISRIEPEDNKEILLHDSELQGIETAMNNLIFRMKENYRQQARFVNDASHELRTPIAVIEGYANMLARWGKEDEKVLEESITAIKNESENMKHLVEQLLFLARGDSGKTTLNKETVSVNDMMQEIYEESLMIDENHPYRYTKAADNITVNADPGLLKQAVRILIDNAAKYTKQGDEIMLATGMTEDGHPYLQVQDTGIGMAEKDVEHMFERFYRADEARNTAGTGLGLSIAKWIVDKHNGYFSITSRTDLGTRIRIIL
ncbi:MAG: HAMP domain-containing histidine kinase [Lachnospiraceae bacterium]|nr:HAMP domain-containing histidine kinase [Lachnospiraceae bacterium]